MKVKKPDFIGDSMWQFHYENRTLDVKIADITWLKSYQNGDVLVMPGDAIKGQVLIEVEYGHEGDVISTRHTLTVVESIIKKSRPRQGQMFTEPDNPNS